MLGLKEMSKLILILQKLVLGRKRQAARMDTWLVILPVTREQITTILDPWGLRIKQKQKSSGTGEVSLLLTAWVRVHSKR